MFDLRKKINRRGFTLVEIMIVVAIIALLAAIAIPNLLRTRIIANDGSAKATLKSIANALESYYAINTTYPTSSTSLLGATPPYLSTDYFTGVHNGFSYNYSVTSYTYSITASPNSSTAGTTTFTLTTGGVVQ